MDNFYIAEKIENQAEALILEAILAALDKLTEHVMTLRDTKKKPVGATADKF